MRRALSLVSSLALLAACSSAAPPGGTPLPRPKAEAPVDKAWLPAAICDVGPKADPRWWDEAVGYEIFVRSFQDSDGDGKGDLKGLTSRLDYLKDLGVDLLWLMPITESPSYHGYDVTDYKDVEDDYGTLEDLDAMLAAAKERGIRVIMDLVVNHSSSKHPWFTSKPPGESDYYVWSDEGHEWDRPWGPGPTWHSRGDKWFYALFWEGMPDLNFTTRAVVEEMHDISRFWLKRGMAGFRLDAARYIIETGEGPGQADTPETHAFWREYRRTLEPEFPEALFLGEVWTDSTIVGTYFGTEAEPELHMNFDFDAAGASLGAIKDGKAEGLQAALCKRFEAFPPHASPGSFLTNHDQWRLATVIDKTGPAGAKLAAALLLSMPGTPWLYYGEEVGLRLGTSDDDIAKRLPMQWAPGAGVGFTTGEPWAPPRDSAPPHTIAHQMKDTGSLWSQYKRMIALRKAHPALATGGARLLEVSGSAGAPLALFRHKGGEWIWALFNFSAVPNEITLTDTHLPKNGLHFVDLASRGRYERAPGQPLKLILPARGVALLSLAPQR